MFRRVNYRTISWNDGRTMSTVASGSYVIAMGSNKNYDVYEELLKTKHVPHIHHDGCIFFDADVDSLISRFIQAGGYADLTLAEYLDGFYQPIDSA